MFNERVEPEKAKNWLYQAEIVFERLKYVDPCIKVPLDTFNLVGKAKVWWRAIKRCFDDFRTRKKQHRIREWKG